MRERRKIRPMTPGVPHGARVRAYLAGGVVSLCILGVGMRAWALQVGQGDHFRDLADRQHAMSVDIPAPRGEIVDTHGSALAVSADADSIWANPRSIRDVTAIAAQLAPLVPGIDAATLESKLAGDRSFVWIARHVAPEVAIAVRAAKLPGIEVAKEPRRWYPGRTLAGPVIGRADIDGKGVDGIELAMNSVLTGTRGAGNAVRDAHGRRMFADGMEQPEPGATVQLTIDRSIQAIADRAIADAVTVNKAKSGVVVVLDVATSRVLAMSTYPTYDPNAASPTPARNRPVTDAYEAGSVMKVFTIAGALDAGVVRPDTELDLHGGYMVIGRIPIHDVDGDKSLTVEGVVKRSSNVGAALIAQRLGKLPQEEALRRFGFGSKSGIELPGEQMGMLRSATRWRDSEQATIAFGMGLTVTPLQIVAGVAALGNDGIYHAPRVIERVTGPDGVRELPIGPERRVVSSKTATQMRKILGSVFEGGKLSGTAAGIVVPGFVCGGKTGTAHKWDSATHHYSLDRYLSSFVGLAPLDHPRLAIIAMIDEPSPDSHMGAKVAGPVFAAVASESLRYLGVPGESLVCPPVPPGPRPLVIRTKVCTIPSPPVSRPGATAPAAGGPTLAPAGLAAPVPADEPVDVLPTEDDSPSEAEPAITAPPPG